MPDNTSRTDGLLRYRWTPSDGEGRQLAGRAAFSAAALAAVTVLRRPIRTVEVSVST